MSSAGKHATLVNSGKTRHNRCQAWENTQPVQGAGLLLIDYSKSLFCVCSEWFAWVFLTSDELVKFCQRKNNYSREQQLRMAPKLKNRRCHTLPDCLLWHLNKKLTVSVRYLEKKLKTLKITCRMVFETDKIFKTNQSGCVALTSSCTCMKKVFNHNLLDCVVWYFTYLDTFTPLLDRYWPKAPPMKFSLKLVTSLNIFQTENQRHSMIMTSRL